MGRLPTGKQSHYSEADKAKVLEAFRLSGGKQRPTARQFGIPLGTLQAWIAGDEDPRPFASLLPTVTESQINANAFLKGLECGSVYQEKHLRDAVAENVEAVFAALAIPAPVSISTEYVISKGCRVDFLARHEDGTYTLAEIKSCSGGNKGRGWLLYSLIGQALYYLEVLSDVYKIPTEKIRVCLLLDYDPDDYFLKALEHVKCPFYVLNVARFLQKAND